MGIGLLKCHKNRAYILLWVTRLTSVITAFLFFILIPFLCQQEITDVAVLDPVSAHVELIQRDNIFRVVIADIVIRAELTLNGLIGCHGRQCNTSHWRQGSAFPASPPA